MPYPQVGTPLKTHFSVLFFAHSNTCNTPTHANLSERKRCSICLNLEVGPRHADCHLPRAAESEFQLSPDAQTRRDALIKRLESTRAWSLAMAGRRGQLGSTWDSEYETQFGLAVKDFREAYLEDNRCRCEGSQGP